jgi:transcriptional regulator with XRE-family HTH domain
MQKIRKEKGYTQKQLAEKCGMATGTIQQYELNKREPRREQLQKIATALNVPLYELMGFDGSIRVNGNKQRPFDIAIQKLQNKEGLTYEEEDIITEYVESEQFKQEKDDIKQIAQKAYDYISFMHSHSYASSAEELDKLQEERQIEFEEKRTKPFTASLSQTHNKENDIYIDPNLQKLYDSYEDSYSFDNLGEKRLLKDYRMLNEIGQLEARKRVAELTEIPRYTKPDDPPQE